MLSFDQLHLRCMRAEPEGLCFRKVLNPQPSGVHSVVSYGVWCTPSWRHFHLHLQSQQSFNHWTWNGLWMFGGPDTDCVIEFQDCISDEWSSSHDDAGHQQLQLLMSSGAVQADQREVHGGVLLEMRPFVLWRRLQPHWPELPPCLLPPSDIRGSIVIGIAFKTRMFHSCAISLRNIVFQCTRFWKSHELNILRLGVRYSISILRTIIFTVISPPEQKWK